MWQNCGPFGEGLSLRAGGRIRSGPEVGKVATLPFCAFQPFLNSPQKSEYFEYRHMGWNKKIPPRRMPKTKSAAPPAPTKHTVPCDNFGVRRGGGGAPPAPFGVGSRPGPAPVRRPRNSGQHMCTKCADPACTACGLCLQSCHVMPCHVLSCHVQSCHVMSCQVMSCHVMSCHVMSCQVMSCQVKLPTCKRLSHTIQQTLTTPVTVTVNMPVKKAKHVVTCFASPPPQPPPP